MVEIGQKAPELELVDTDLKKVKIPSDFKGKVVVLAFYPAAFTSVCTKEMCTFRDSMAKFNEVNAVVIGVSVDPPFSNKAFKEQNKLNFTIVSDFNREAVKAYGVAGELPILKGYVLAKRSVFVIDKNGIIRYKWVSEDPTKEPNYDEIKDVISKLS
ncbi:alkyl hydroperoxide reductase/ Thiol specific antioxidant/ Mal allergen [Sulfolobus islandicus Y.G.57.14]|jgi:peroxiredoxin|uniref:Peroxiredoxin n=10 Tax=Saccharolobus islandicus TaxID=43080 RepID=M9UAA7_SACIS|nr:peroxiredoxin [Sulfolobus islandicus]ACP36799.1 alkyl hydroperoxide reductase/ Thiol specific antioxidant/ Mal allergen [Sulfolobus islandicus L.S.2.15]ACP39408.1 alkyl hydroperoxide reductase/ Thiol specific antioxidant/ Mal allergen [Sulfolobus islandicus M.14.25]ACP47098.1 alkyl hydroperoxide reductase/ Thiol specific antioxidant/ Mal allergen [Sulfolobus islandicus Y.G.57.14]ACP49949.1 alkyl hydroperoxide reductase/ Thiol specific antioxidant/ Mal allergen [Sulfolobus islandicus Y.N.15.5